MRREGGREGGREYEQESGRRQEDELRGGSEDALTVPLLFFIYIHTHATPTPTHTYTHVPVRESQRAHIACPAAPPAAGKASPNSAPGTPCNTPSRRSAPDFGFPLRPLMRDVGREGRWVSESIPSVRHTLPHPPHTLASPRLITRNLPPNSQAPKRQCPQGRAIDHWPGLG